mmetsp:Transcript_14012/g.33483  ORF Transcript_14012/g.33483 Transcript_14012/m.33483 type:complete len:92 (-) Transcript_14012:31-306(-)
MANDPVQGTVVQGTVVQGAVIQGGGGGIAPTCTDCGQPALFTCTSCGVCMCQAHRRLWRAQVVCIPCQDRANRSENRLAWAPAALATCAVQ